MQATESRSGLTWKHSRIPVFTRPQFQVKGKLTTTAVINIRPKTKVDNVLKNNGEDENTERDKERIMHDFDYHDTINAESYEKYFENICELLSQIVLLLLITPQGAHVKILTGMLVLFFWV